MTDKTKNVADTVNVIVFAIIAITIICTLNILATSIVVILTKNVWWLLLMCFNLPCLLFILLLLEKLCGVIKGLHEFKEEQQ